ncbi:Eco57I restriction-modification methylase domain-containing protein [Helicobacter didelphidarum]|uniref:Eco57I restriction-modification methylase domain-containing protein n=1 Tax=Helicobacter didelphidarum TaxID=2040648 RepID=UPI001FEBD260|nr:N-6 DNA methylase [Helicobacter didelphidarum]
MVDFPQIYDFAKYKRESCHALEQIKAIYDTERFKAQNEHQFEDEFITKVLEILGWSFIRQEEKIIQGKLEKPDFLLFSSTDSKSDYESIPKDERHATNEYISIILESKAYSVEVDSKKVKDNPHFQLLRYLSSLKLDYGFLSNGRVWRFYDNSKLSSNKIFYEIDLESIVLCDDVELKNRAFDYFYHIFHARNFAVQDSATLTIQTTLEKNNQAKIAIEDDLQSIIYGINGKDSLFEKIGACIYEKNKEVSLEEVYQNSLYFIFRLLFIAYFEDKFDEVLAKHSHFNDAMSLQKLLVSMRDSKDKESFKLLSKLNSIFKIYDKGEPNLDIPIFNGGLFDESKTKLLSTPKIFNDEVLYGILHELFTYNNGVSVFKRDYCTLSVTHLGTIYEGLLSYFFNIASEDIYYIKYIQRGKNKAEEIEGYFDSYDLRAIEKSHKIIGDVQSYTKGQIYLKNTSNSRKSTASFYTPESITSFLVESALQDNLDDSNILTFKILDNACGSGHFLVKALNLITQIVIERFDSFPSLHALYEREKQSIESHITDYIQGYVIDESDIVKRLLLKRVIFGIDLNPFSIELTKLSLWIDSFIFGTPLSFIEHHIKCGNALIGTTIAEFKRYYDELQKIKSKGKGAKAGASLFIDNFLDRFNTLSEIFEKLDCLKDSNESEITESKRIYNDEIKPTLDNLNLYLNYLNVKGFVNAVERKRLDSLESSGLETILEDSKLKAIIQSYCEKYRFFNYEIEFPEIVTNNNFVGFQAIVGNPPWDKTKFSDNDFFPQYQSNYRTLSNSKKKEIATNLLSKAYIKREYDEAKALIESSNNYYKAHYPLNAGSGDGNLFRFFVERNLSLLAPQARLNYVLPSALMFEEGSYALRKEIWEQRKLEYFYSFENREGIFHSVHRSYKFAMMSVANAKAPTKHTIRTMFYKTDINEAIDAHKSFDKLALKNSPKSKKIKSKKLESATTQSKQTKSTNPTKSDKTPPKSKYDEMSVEELQGYAAKIIHIDFATIQALSPNQLALMELRSGEDLAILEKCYTRFSPLDSQWLDFRRELDMTNDKDLFIESPSDGLLPLYEGKMIHQFNARFENAQYFLDKEAFDRRLRSKEIYRLKQDLGIDSKEYERIIESLLSRHTDNPSRHTEAVAEVSTESNSHCEEQGDKVRHSFRHCEHSEVIQKQNIDCHADKSACNDKVNADSMDCHEAKASRNDECDARSKTHNPTKESNRHCERSEAIQNATKPTKESIEDSIIAYDREFVRLGFRAIARDTDERTLIFSLLPKDCGFGHSMFGANPKQYILDSKQIKIKAISNLRILFALGLLNSVIVDFIARGMVQINVSKTYLQRIPLPQPSDEEIESDSVYSQIARNALILQLYNDKAGDFAELASEFAISKNEIPKTRKLYDTLRARNDIMIAKLYGITKEEFCYILDTFKVLNNKQPQYVAILKDLWE